MTHHKPFYIILMLTQIKPNYGLFIVCTILYSIINLILAAFVITEIINGHYTNDDIFYFTYLVWQFAHIGICCYFYFTGNSLPLAIKIYFYIDMCIFGILALAVVVLIINFIIGGCHQDSSYFPACFLEILLFTGIFAVSWGYD